MVATTEGAEIKRLFPIPSKSRMGAGDSTNLGESSEARALSVDIDFLGTELGPRDAALRSVLCRVEMI